MSVVPCGICHQVFCRCTQGPSFLTGGIPVKVNPFVPSDEVWLRSDTDLVRLVNLANGEAEVARLRRRIATLERRLARVLEDAQVGHRRSWRDGATRGRVWSRRHDGTGGRR